jgi:cytochrome oxidase Cu insertion factor (SCO1/SenC/PrrC family)
MRWVRIAAYGLLAVAATLWGGFWFANGGAKRLGLDGDATGVTAGVTVGGPFNLVDSTGKPVTDADFRGKWMLVYFGYTFCPDVCPTELQVIASALDGLGPDAAKITPIFITIDPERDTREIIGGYVKLFDDRLVGLTGSVADIAAVARAYRVYYAKAERKDTTQYLMDHSSFLYLMGPDGKLRGLYRPGSTAQELTATLRSRLAGS